MQNAGMLALPVDCLKVMDTTFVDMYDKYVMYEKCRDVSSASKLF
jgi:hypothetical protein